MINKYKSNLRPKNSLFVACLLSFLLHALLVLSLFLVDKPSKQEQPKMSDSMKTSLISKQDIQAIKQAWAAQQRSPATQINSPATGQLSDIMTPSQTPAKSEPTTPPAKSAGASTKKSRTAENLKPNDHTSQEQATKNPVTTPEVAQPPVDLEQLRLDVQARIYQAWQDQSINHPSNQALGFVVELDDLGYVKRINFGGGHRDLRPSAQAAVYAAQPFTEFAGLRSSFSMYLVTTQEIYQAPEADLQNPKEDPWQDWCLPHGPS